MQGSRLYRLLLIPLTALVLPSLLAQQPEAAPAAQPQAQSQEPAQPAPPAQPKSPAETPSPTPSNPAQPVKNSDGTYSIRTISRLVVLDMVVVDNKGAVVKDLSREDFHVEESGQPQTILSFEAARKHIPAPELTINSTADLDRLAPRAPVDIILLDEFNTRFEDMAFARYSLKKYLDKQPDKLITPTMLIAVSLQNFTVLHDYTQNKEEIISALDHHFVAYPWQVHQGAWVSERYATAFITLRRVAEAVTGHQGHKNMIWIGRGFPPSRMSVPIDTENRIFNAVQDCVNVLRDARITLYTIDPAGVMVDPGNYGGDPRIDPFGGNYEFNRLAKATGGRTLYGRNDVDLEIQTAIQDGANIYSLSYRPVSNISDLNKFRKINVTVDRPGLHVITREGYYLQGGQLRVNAEKPSRRLLADIVSADSSNMVYDGVPIEVHRSTTDADSFMVHVDGHGLVWKLPTDTEPHRTTELILATSTFDKKGKELKQDARVMQFAAPANAAPTGRILINVDAPYHLTDHDRKAVRIRFTVRISATGRIGTADLPLGDAAGETPPAK
ncbi:MAG: VWA domain-containing protein [Terracidiphilus sp.]|jgi:VWFA-related protein